jgi:hypothetical protein
MKSVHILRTALDLQVLRLRCLYIQGPKQCFLLFLYSHFQAAASQKFPQLHFSNHVLNFSIPPKCPVHCIHLDFIVTYYHKVLTFVLIGSRYILRYFVFNKHENILSDHISLALHILWGHAVGGTVS